MKQSNGEWNCDTHQATFASKYPARDSRKKACQEILSKVQASQQQLSSLHPTRRGDYNFTCCAEALAIVRNRKPFTDGEYAKAFMLDIAIELSDDFPNKDTIIKPIQDMPLLTRTVYDCSITMVNQVQGVQVKDINAGMFLSLVSKELP